MCDIGDFTVICLLIITVVKQYSAVGPDDPINVSFDMHPNDEDSVSIYVIV